GRVNLIGEHTDYNDGYVLPFALPHRVAAAVAPRGDTRVTVATRGSDGRLQHAAPVDLHRLRPGEPGGWASYVAGVVWAFREECGLTHGADLVLAGTVPSGAGLSSSAALECAVALALTELTDRTDPSGAPSPEPDLRTRRRLARLAQRAENEFVGVPTGALDQTAALCCVPGHALFFDVGTGTLEQIPFDTAAAGLRVFVVDTRVKHALGDSAYGDRRAATAAAARELGLGSLREVTPDRLDDTVARLPGDLAPLVTHVVSENARVLDVVRHLRAGRPGDIGPALNASHDSLRDDYRVSCPELDLAVGAARSAGALGARMTGGGFGGSALALVRA
ncbi:galactokinase, partial [Saccharomonospora iraqiensis]|uniref:galactokinase n=1 Tax=Saccharomonospora iraqiensis TaxID=52698 RepID=UPI00022DF56B